MVKEEHKHHHHKHHSTKEKHKHYSAHEKHKHRHEHKREKEKVENKVKENVELLENKLEGDKEEAMADHESSTSDSEDGNFVRIGSGI